MSFLVYLAQIFVAKGLASAEPSFIGELIPGIPVYTKDEIYASLNTAVHTRTSLVFLALVGILFALYAVTLRALRDVKSDRLPKLVYAAGAAFLLIYLFSPVMLSTDVFAYGMYGRVFAVFGANPYNTTAPLPPDDPFLKHYGQTYLASWYGPLWTLISGGVALASGKALGLSVLLFRLLTMGALLGAGALHLANLRRHSPEKAAQGLAFLMWNPLLVLETGLSGHNDAVMLLLVIFGIWLHLRGWKTGAVAALACSTLIKFLTGLILPLYIVMVVRQLPTWRERRAFLGKSAAVGVLFLTLLVTFTRSDPGAASDKEEGGIPVVNTVMSPAFYLNNYHEVIFHAFRRLQGEEEETIQAPIYYTGWWVAVHEPKRLHASPSATSPVVGEAGPGSKLIVIAPNMTDWIYVYDPATRRRGHLDSAAGVDSIEPPVEYQNNPVVAQVEQGPLASPVVHRANLWVRLIFWSLFAAFYAAALWRVRDFESFVVGSAATMIASYYLIITELWPWYANWAVALAALVPTHRVAKYAALLSMFMLTLYVTMGYENTDWDPVYTYRGVLAFLVPLVLFGLYSLMAKHRKARRPA